MSDTILLKVKRGLASSLKTTEIENGTFRVTTDSQKLYFDIDDVRLPLGDLEFGHTEAEVKALDTKDILPKIYLTSDTSCLLYYNTANGGSWKLVGGDKVAYADEAGKATNDGDGNSIKDTYVSKVQAKDLQDLLQNNIDELEKKVNAINSFEIKLINDIANAPDPGKSNIIYFAKDATVVGSNKYDEYIWVADDDVGNGHYENIGTTEAELTNYYTKAQIDDKESVLQAADETLQNNIDTLTQTVADNKDKAAADLKATKEELNASDATLQNNIDLLTTTVTNNRAAADATHDQLDKLTQTVADNKKAAEDADQAIKDDVATINRFKKEQVSGLPDIDDADDYTLYFVPEDDHYAEYMTVYQKKEDNTTVRKFEKINSVSELVNYYTKEEVDAIRTTLESADAANGNLIDNNAKNITAALKLIAQNKDTLDAVDKGLDERLTTVETNLGTTNDGDDVDTIFGRVKKAEETINANETDIEQKVADLTATVQGNKEISDAADKDASGRIEVLETAVGKYPTEDGTKTITERLDTAEKAIGAYPTAEGTKDIVTRLDEIEAKNTEEDTNIETNKTDIAALTQTVADNKKASEDADSALDARVTTLETDTKANQEADETRLTKLETDAAALAKTVDDNETDIEQKVSDLTTTVSDNKTASDEKDSDLQTQITELKDTVGKINRFEIKVLDKLPESGETYVIYFVPAEDTNGGKTKYTEYMWIPSEDKTTGRFEEIGITEADLTEYYTSAEVDEIIKTVNATITSLQETVESNKGTTDATQKQLDDLSDTVTANKTAADATQTQLDTLSQTVTDNKTASDAKDAELQQGVDDINTELAKHNWNYANSSNENGAADKVVQTESTETVSQSVLVAGNDNTVQTVSKAKVNASTGDVTTEGKVTADSAVVNSLTVGGATLTYDKDTDTLAVDFA